MAASGSLGNVCASMLVRGTIVIQVVTLLVAYKQYCISQLTANISQKWKFNSDSIGTLITLGWLIMLQSQGFSDYMLNFRISLSHVAHHIKNIKQLCRSLGIPISKLKLPLEKSEFPMNQQTSPSSSSLLNE